MPSISAAVGGGLHGHRGSGTSVTFGFDGAIDGNHDGSARPGDTDASCAPAHPGRLMDISINATHERPALIFCSPPVDDRQTVPKERLANIGQLADTT